ncbi:MAG: AMP-binding protein [Burkholderiales bacterium]|nr:AMP-binding protein [Burkholderiales bacterium]
MNLAHLCIERSARRLPQRIAVVDGDTGAAYSYAHIDECAGTLAHALLAMGVRRGDRVGIYLRNTPEFILAFLAAAKIGAVCVPFNIMFKRAEIGYILNDSGCRLVCAAAEEAGQNILPHLDDFPGVEHLILVGEAPLPAAPPGRTLHRVSDLLAGGPRPFAAVEVDPGDAVSILYTSGTTGRPKGAVASHANWRSAVELSAYQIVPMTDEDRVLTGGPFFHVYFVIAVLPVLLVGGTVVTLGRFFADAVLRLIGRHKVSHFMGTPTMWVYLLDEYERGRERYDVASLWQGQSAGSALPAELARRIESTLPIRHVECYGATECSSTVTHTRIGHLTPGSPGWSTPGWEIKIVGDDGQELPNGEIGELWCRGPGVIKEYWRDPEMTRTRIVDGWWRSGDLGYIASGGHTDAQLYIVDRKTDMIICGGNNIYPREVEDYMLRHPQISQSVVIGIPDATKGEVPKAFVVLKPGERTSAEEIVRYCKENMAAFKVPRSVEIVTLDDLPKTASGKILKRELRDMEKRRLGGSAG